MSAEQSPIETIFCSAKQAADALNLNVASVYLLLDDQKIKSQYFGRRRLVDIESVREYAKSLSIYPTGPVS